MKKSFAVLAVLILAGCSTLTYQAPDGGKISYMSFMGTTDSLKAGTVELKAKNVIDPATISGLLAK